MSANQPTTENLGQVVADTAVATLQGMMPVVVAAGVKAAAAASPQAAAAVFATEMVGYLIQARQAPPSSILTLYQGLGPEILQQQATIDAEAAARGVNDAAAPAATTGSAS